MSPLLAHTRNAPSDNSSSPNDMIAPACGDYLTDRSITEEQRRRQGIAVLYSVFGDESHDETNERVFAVAGLFGSQEEWEGLEAAWLERTGGKVFHAANCEADYGDFAGIDHRENLRLYADLTRILANSRLMGFGVAHDLVAYRHFFPEAIADMPYYKCFRDVVERFAETARLCIPPAKVRYTFDQRLESQYNAAALYNYMVNQPEWEHRSHLFEEVGFATRKLVGIQAADLYAREVMKHLDNIVGPVKRPTRQSMQTLRRTNRFGCDFLVEEYWRDFREKYEALLTATAISRDEYHAWLVRQRLTDNFSVRLRYLIEFEKRTVGRREY